MTINIESIIRNYVDLNARPNSKGWLPILCKVCNDHGKKGARAAFLFTETGMKYHCFNCSIKGTYSSDQTEELSLDTIKILKAFDIPDEEIMKINFNILQHADKNGHHKQPTQSTQETQILEIKMPACCIKLSDIDDNNIWKQITNLYLTETRGIDPSSYPFYIGFKQPKDSTTDRWDKRLIIPVYKDNKLIYFEGRDLTGNQPKKYISADVPKCNIFYGFDKLYTQKEKPLFVCEGFFDAFVVNGVAVFGNTLYKETIQHLTKSPRTKVIIPDKYGDGYRLALQALKLGWKISTPDIGDCTDISEAVVKYGKMYIIKSIMENIHSDFAAETNLRFYCKNMEKINQKGNKSKVCNGVVKHSVHP